MSSAESVTSDDSSVSDATTASTTTAAPETRRSNQKSRRLKTVRRLVGRVLKPFKPMFKNIKFDDVVDKLRHNNSEFTVLKLDGSHTNLDFKRLIKAIEDNVTVTNIQIHGGLVANLPQEEQHVLWHALGNLPNLAEAHFKYFSEHPFHIDALNCFLSRATGLRKLSIYDSDLISRDASQGLISLKQHTKLKTVFLSHLCLPSDRVLDPILGSLLTAPKLSNITIRIPRRRKNLIQTETLCLLMQKKTLKVLELRRTVLTDEQVIRLAQDLETSKMKEVTIQCDDTLREECSLALAKMLKSNSTLTRLEVWGQAVEEDGFIDIVDSLVNNVTLKILHLSHDIQEHGHNALTKLFQTNRTLETLYMRSFGDSEMMTKTDYFLKLNSTKLRGLQLDLNMDRGEFVEKIEKHSTDINHVYFLLRGNPNIISASHQWQYGLLK